MPDTAPPPKTPDERLSAAYVRVSKVDQDAEHQIRRYREMGIPEGLIFIDAGTSGAKHHMKRPQFRQMNALVEGGDVGTLWVSELTRLGRDTLGTIECLI